VVRPGGLTDETATLIRAAAVLEALAVCPVTSLAEEAAFLPTPGSSDRGSCRPREMLMVKAAPWIGPRLNPRAPHVTHGTSILNRGVTGMDTRYLALVGSLVLVLAASQGVALADWKTNAAKKTVGRAAKEGMENAAKNAAVDVALEAAVPAGSGDISRRKPDPGTAIRPAAGDVGRGKPAAGTAIGAAAGEGVEAAMTAANVASSIDAAADVADAAKRVNKIRKVIP
jgi:hypothetical protein